MTQLILDTNGLNVVLPESQKGGYNVREENLSVDVTMISGRMVRELRGTVWVVDYQYGYFGDEDKDRVISACKKGKKEPILCSFLSSEGNAMVSSRFFVTDFTFPKFMWSRNERVEQEGSFINSPVPLWSDFSVSLREVDPHD